jgi:DNA-binding IscR family transcriptional regulator
MTAEFPLAVHALVYLLHTGKQTSSQELADNICTNQARVRKVLSKLHRAGLVEAERGKNSGYRIRGDGSVSLRSVLEALEEDPISMNWRSGDMDRECLVSSGMGTVMDELYARMNGRCMDELGQSTLDTIIHRLFDGKDGQA